MEKQKQKLTKKDIKQIKDMQYCIVVFERMEANKATDSHRQEANKVTSIVINDDHDYMVYSKLLELDCLTPEENKVIQDALSLYEKNGKVAEDDFELIDKMITESDLNQLENMFKNNNNKRR